MKQNSYEAHGSTDMLPHRFEHFLPVVTHLPSEKSILSNFSSPRGVAILGCESHSQAGSASQIKVFVQELGLKQWFLACTNMDYLTSECPGTHSFKVDANFDMFPQKYG